MTSSTFEGKVLKEVIDSWFSEELQMTKDRSKLTLFAIRKTKELYDKKVLEVIEKRVRLLCLKLADDEESLELDLTKSEKRKIKLINQLTEHRIDELNNLLQELGFSSDKNKKECD